MNSIYYHQNTLCVEANWLIDVANIITNSNYKLLKHRNRLKVIRRGCRNTPALVAYDSIPERFKEQIIEICGDPYESTKQHLFKDYLNNDLKAVEYYNNYTLDNGGSLPQEKIAEYVANAVILNAVGACLKATQARRGALGGRVGQLWERLSEIIPDLPRHTYPHSIPTNSRSLRNKYKLYVKKGYESIIHKGFCNKNSEKINPEAGQWVISKWANQVERCANLAQLLEEYNFKAAYEGWKPLKEESTLRLFLDQESVKYLWYGHRHGELKAKEKFSYQHSTKMPTMRDSLWYSDGTKLNYYYLNENGKVSTCQVYEVMDAYSEVFLGFHISKTEDYEAQYSAYKMAVQNAGHRPYQIGFDNQGGHKKLDNGNFLSQLARISIKTQPYNGKSKTIESAFGRFQKQFLKRDWFFTGQNIDTKSLESKANMEFILANTKNLPTLKEIKAIYEERRQQWNEAPHHKTGEPRIQMYMNSHNPEAPELSMWDMVDLFWIQRPKPVTVSAYGISFKEKKEEYNYMVTKDGLPDLHWLTRHIDMKVYIKFDPQDMSMIYLYKKTPLGLAFLCEATTKIEVARGVQEQDELDNQVIRKINDMNKAQRIANRDETQDILERHGATPEQQGLNTPNLKGIETIKKGRKGKEADRQTKKVQEQSFGQYTKDLSNEVVITEDVNEDIEMYKQF